MAAANVANYLPFLCSMAAANVARINHADPGPSDTTLLTQQPNHRSEAIWNGQDPGTLTCRSRSSEFSNREPMVDDRVVNIMKALVERGPPVGAYGPPVRAPLALKWLWVPNKKNRPAHIFRDRYREQLASMLPSQVVWQPYEAEFDHLPPWCVAGRAVWTAKVPLVCFHLIEKHTPERVVRQFGMIQGIPPSVDTDTVLHKIDLRGKVGVDWMRRHAVHIVHWRNRLQRRFEVVLGEMPPQHEYFGWFDRVTRRFIDRPGAKLTMLVSLVNRLSRHHPVGTEEHEDITDVLTAVHRIDRVQPPIPEAPNEDAATPVVLTPDSSPYTPHASPSLTIPAFTSHPSLSRTIPAFTSHPSPRFPYTPHASPSLTILAFTSHPSPRFTISAFTSHPSPTFTIPSSTPHPSPSPTIPHPAPRPTIPPPTPHPCHGSDIRPPLPQSFPELSPIPSFYLGFHPTPPEMQQEPPSHSTSIAPSLAIDPPHIQAEQAVGLPAMAEGRPKRISKPPPCGTGGHKHGHKAGPEASDEEHARPPPRYTRQPKVQKR
nr:serine/threonine-protein phosphatase 7 long form like [Quercus suber]